MKLVIATCQFPTSGSVENNYAFVLQQMSLAKSRGARVAHFPECCLTGYAGHDVETYRHFDWQVAEELARSILEHARNLGLWVVLGAAHRLLRGRKPHNSLYIISDKGEVVDRYDKRFCAGDSRGKTGDLAHFSPGDHDTIFTIDGVKCGTLICHEYRYPELYRDYKRKGVEMLFHSYHAANASAARFRKMESQVGKRYHALNRGTTLPEITMTASMQAAAASSHLWISCSNSSARQSCWASFFVRPDGVTVGRLRRNNPGILLTTIDTGTDLYDSTVAWRDRAMHGVFHSGKLVEDQRSKRRNEI